MSVTAIRVSKTSLKAWTLHGPIDQALKTTIQADAVRVVNLHDSSGSTELELWIAADGEDRRHRLNLAAMVILAINDQRTQDATAETAAWHHDDEEGLGFLIAQLTEESTRVYGPAVLTGPGGSDVPDIDMEHLMTVLLGNPHK